jgi:hypothetical protein
MIKIRFTLEISDPTTKTLEMARIVIRNFEGHNDAVIGEKGLKVAELAYVAREAVAKLRVELEKDCD